MTTPFRIPLRDEPWPIGRHAARPCPVCRKRWIPWAWSRLSCHARCLFTPGAQMRIRSDPRCDAELVKKYGVSVSVIRAVRHVRKSTKRPKRAYYDPKNVRVTITLANGAEVEIKGLTDATDVLGRLQQR